MTNCAFPGALHEATGALSFGAGKAASLIALAFAATGGVNRVWPVVGAAKTGETLNLIEVNAGKLWRGAIVVAGLAIFVSEASAEVAVFPCALADLTNEQGTAKNAGTNRTSRGFEADMAEMMLSTNDDLKRLLPLWMAEMLRSFANPHIVGKPFGRRLSNLWIKREKFKMSR